MFNANPLRGRSKSRFKSQKPTQAENAGLIDKFQFDFSKKEERQRGGFLPVIYQKKLGW